MVFYLHNDFYNVIENINSFNLSYTLYREFEMVKALKLIFVQQVLAEYVTSDLYAAVFVSSD